MLVELSIRMQPDGGMPGATARNRIVATVAAAHAFGSDLGSSPFQAHIRRMVQYLRRALLEDFSGKEIRAMQAATDGAGRLAGAGDRGRGR
jgi:hypothetical protein